MRGVNLIPARRRLARQRRTRVTAWSAAAVAYAGVLGMVYAWAASRDGAKARDWNVEVVKGEAEASEFGVQLARVRADTQREESALNAAAAVEEQPDWSMLFGLLARTAGTTVWIESASLKPDAAGAAPTPANRGGSSPAASGRLVFAVSGLGESHEAVSTFVLGLESTGLFERVTPLEMRRQQANGVEVIAFKIECVLEGGA